MMCRIWMLSPNEVECLLSLLICLLNPSGLLYQGISTFYLLRIHCAEWNSSVTIHITLNTHNTLFIYFLKQHIFRFRKRLLFNHWSEKVCPFLPKTIIIYLRNLFLARVPRQTHSDIFYISVI
jgi:hypothetical protein